MDLMVVTIILELQEVLHILIQVQQILMQVLPELVVQAQLLLQALHIILVFTHIL